MTGASAPRFWYTPTRTAVSLCLEPLTYLWRGASAVRKFLARPYTSPLPVLCVGNVTVGGSGKTPACIALVAALQNKNPCFLTRGYGGQTEQAALVDNENAEQWGDEAILLARHAPTIVAPDRVEGLHLAQTLGYGMVICDDGFQNPHFSKTASLLVFDGSTGIGNSACVPAGPCREPLDDALKRATAALIIGPDKTELALHLAPLPVFSALVEAHEPVPQQVVAFAGIGHPDKFFKTLSLQGYDVIESVSFPDHHPFDADDLKRLQSLAARHQARLITTEKDYVRVPAPFRADVDVLGISLVIDSKDDLLKTLSLA